MGVVYRSTSDPRQLHPNTGDNPWKLKLRTTWNSLSSRDEEAALGMAASLLLPNNCLSPGRDLVNLLDFGSLGFVKLFICRVS